MTTLNSGIIQVGSVGDLIVIDPGQEVKFEWSKPAEFSWLFFDPVGNSLGHTISGITPAPWLLNSAGAGGVSKTWASQVPFSFGFYAFGIPFPGIQANNVGLKIPAVGNQFLSVSIF